MRRRSFRVMIDSLSVSSLSSGGGLYLFRSHAEDVYLNLAREEYLLDSLPQDSRALLLYVDSPAVVIGKHQNPWRECAVAKLKARAVPLARRISGGGTVYHDDGNLNFSFLLPKEGFDRRANLALVVKALERLGVEASVSDRYDIQIGSRKISGNAFCFRRERALHHGTLLVRSRLEELRGALRGISSIETFAVESRPAPVANLSEFRSSVEVDTVADALVDEVSRSWRVDGGPAPRRIDEATLDNDGVAELAARNRTAEWIYDRTPKFTVTVDLPAALLPAAQGNAPSRPVLRLTVEGGRVSEEPQATCDGLPERFAALFLPRLAGIRFGGASIAEALDTSAELSALARWFRAQPF